MHNHALCVRSTATQRTREGLNLSQKGLGGSEHVADGARTGRTCRKEAADTPKQNKPGAEPEPRRSHAHPMIDTPEGRARAEGSPAAAAAAARASMRAAGPRGRGRGSPSTCAGSPWRRASGTGRSPEVGPARARRPRRPPEALPSPCRLPQEPPAPPSSPQPE